jgi:hypothetical protein
VVSIFITWLTHTGSLYPRSIGEYSPSTGFS